MSPIKHVKSGNSGKAYGNHLHYELRKDRNEAKYSIWNGTFQRRLSIEDGSKLPTTDEEKAYSRLIVLVEQLN
jgi:murein DD-endopeptidase MepM/ murein hydrolase activator NlpD